MDKRIFLEHHYTNLVIKTSFDKISDFTFPEEDGEVNTGIPLFFKQKIEFLDEMNSEIHKSPCEGILVLGNYKRIGQYFRVE